MKNKIQSVKVSEWVEALSSSHLEHVPPEWKTSDQISREIGKSRSRTSALLMRGLQEGKIERRMFSIISGARGVCPVPHYRIIKK